MRSILWRSFLISVKPTLSRLRRSMRFKCQNDSHRLHHLNIAPLSQGSVLLRAALVIFKITSLLFVPLVLNTHSALELVFVCAVVLLGLTPKMRASFRRKPESITLFSQKTLLKHLYSQSPNGFRLSPEWQMLEYATPNCFYLAIYFIQFQEDGQ